MQWIKARKEGVTAETETIEQARRCPSCRAQIKTLTPNFGGQPRKDEDIDIPSRPLESNNDVNCYYNISSIY